MIAKRPEYAMFGRSELLWWFVKSLGDLKSWVLSGREEENGLGTLGV